MSGVDGEFSSCAYIRQPRCHWFTTFRPEALRPRFSTGLPFSIFAALRSTIKYTTQLVETLTGVF